MDKNRKRPCDNCNKNITGWWTDKFAYPVSVCFECLTSHNAYISNHRYNQRCTAYLPLEDDDQPLYAFLEMSLKEQREYLIEQWFPYGYKEHIHGTCTW